MTPAWEVEPLEQLVDFQRGLTYAKSDEVPLSNTVVLRATNIDLASHELDLSDLRYISDTVEVPRNKIVQKDSLLICTASGSKTHLGKVAFIDEDYGYAFGGFMGMLTPRPSILPKYLYYALISPAYKQFIDELSDGANINNLKFSDLGEFNVAVPPLAEQKRIVGILDQALGAIEVAKTNSGKNLSNGSAIFASFVNRALMERSGRWIETTLNQISENLDSKRIPITRAHRKSGVYPYYGASGVVDYVSEYIFEGDHLLISEDGANLLARSSPIAFPASGKFWVNHHAHILRFESEWTRRYVEYFINSIKIDRYVTGAAQPKLTQQALNRIPIAIPSDVAAQQEIVEAFDAVSEQATRLEDIQTRKIAALGSLRNSLLSSAFAGSL